VTYYPRSPRLVSEILSSEGYLVLPATNGAEALAVMDDARVSLALLDMRMPVLDGWGLHTNSAHDAAGFPSL
jgi:CheY-like chemotaxis protein